VRSYGEVVAEAIHLANGLNNHCGLARGTILAVLVDEAAMFLPVVWACLASGIALGLLPETRNVGRARELMDEIGAAFLISDVPELAGLSLDLRGHGPVRCRPLCATSEPGPDDCAFIFPTSGTTGDPKWVAVTHAQFLAAIEALQIGGGLDHASEQIVYIAAPYSHSYGMSSLLEYTSGGNAIVLPSRHSLLGPLGDLIEPAFGSAITAIEGVPHFYQQLARWGQRVHLPNLRHAGVGGGAIEPDTMLDLQVGGRALTYSVRYGLTETPSVVSHKVFAPPYDANWKSSGKVLPIYKVRITGDDGADRRAGEIGEIILYGKCLALPYLKEPGAPGGPFATGDLGYIDLDGELYVVGRKGLILKNRGYRISPESVEAVIRTYDGVVDCRVSISAAGMLAELQIEGAERSVVALAQFLSERLPRYCIPDQMVFVDSIPRTPSGKIRRTPG
jgi:acyl-CoA synthetase (AMP-forming)/AMP-acid ligase II